jgi:DNA-directed RNA polymerase specialized sigma24 family protein
VSDVFNAGRALGIAKFYARKWARRTGMDEASAEDVASEMVIAILVLRRERGIKASRRVYRNALLMAVRRLYGDGRDGRPTLTRFVPAGLLEEVAESSPMPPIVQSDELHGLRLWRLQAIYPTLTPIQRAALLGIACGEDRQDIAARIGTTPGSVDTAMKKAFERIDNPSAFTRRAAGPRHGTTGRRAA